MFIVISAPSCRRFRAMSPVGIYPNRASVIHNRKLSESFEMKSLSSTCALCPSAVTGAYLSLFATVVALRRLCRWLLHLYLGDHPVLWQWQVLLLLVTWAASGWLCSKQTSSHTFGLILSCGSGRLPTVPVRFTTPGLRRRICPSIHFPRFILSCSHDRCLLMPFRSHHSCDSGFAGFLLAMRLIGLQCLTRLSSFHRLLCLSGNSVSCLTV